MQSTFISLYLPPNVLTFMPDSLSPREAQSQATTGLISQIMANGQLRVACDRFPQSIYADARADAVYHQLHVVSSSQALARVRVLGPG